MAALRTLISRGVDAGKRAFAKPQCRRDPLLVLEDADRYRNLPTSVAVLCFFVSAGLGVLAFFAANDAVLWAGVDKQVAAAVIAVSWVMIFPVWALVFLGLMSVLGAMGIKDIRAVVGSRLSERPPSPEQLRELRTVLASRRWRHGRIFRSVLADLSQERPAI